MHTHGAPTGNRLKYAAIATGLFVVTEFLAGWWAHSLALISDAGHNLTDVVALLLTMWAFAMASRPADQERTYGYHRVGVLTALGNALTLVLLAIYIALEGYQRIIHPEPVASLPMIIVALAALGLNGAIVVALHAAGRDDVNVRSAIVHMAGDAISSVGVVLAGIGIWLTGSFIWDPLVSLLIAVFILWSSWSIVRETLNILLEGSPAGLHMEDVVRDMERVPGVRNVHDLHVWSLSSNVRALSAHVEIADAATAPYEEVSRTVACIKDVLASHHNIEHATLETHCPAGHDMEGLHCEIRQTVPASHDAHGHHGTGGKPSRAESWPP